MGFSLIPKDEKFFDLLEEAIDNATRAAQTFHALVQNWSSTSPEIQRITDLEHAGDRMTHELIDKLNRSFITPFDREDILALASEIDDVVDILQATTDRMQLYRIEKTNAHLVKMASVVVQSTQVIGEAVKSLRNLAHTRRTLDFCIEANRLENEGDALLKEALTELFSDHKEVLEIMKWKEIYEATEYATDKCEDIANVIEGIVVKNA